jgi:CheY-like chemotaxis protein
MYSDKNLVQQIVSNLIDNALKFTSTGGVTVETNIIKITDNKIVDIKIIDSGIGIAHEHKDIVFKAFRQVSEGLKRNYEGSGLGLSLTKKMIKLLNGKIVFESIPGKGSIFNVILPVLKSPVKEKREVIYENEPETILLREADKKTKTGLPKILLIEDNEISIKLTQQFLSKTFKLVCIKDPGEALNMVKKTNYDLILMDINLGNEVDGLQLTSEIRKIHGCEKIPIVAVTGYALRGDKERILNGGCTDYIKKPFDKATIIGTINKNLKI